MSNMLMTQPANSMSYSENVDAQRAVQEVQAAYVIAKNYTRNESECLVKIVGACKRKKLAASAMYSYPRGGQNVTGPSIRLAEAVAKYWGNIRYGYKILSSTEEVSLARAYCIDLETNMEKNIDFSVPHYRSTRQGRKKLTDDRDVYEAVASQASRRVRNCIMAVIPEDITEEAIEVCERTLLQADGNIPIAERVKKMILLFAEVSVTPAMLEAKLKHSIDVTTVQEIVNLHKIYISIRDGFAPVTNYFEQTQRASLKEAPKAPVVLFAKKNEELLKKATDTLKNLGVKDIETVIQNMEGKDMDSELLKIAENL